MKNKLIIKTTNLLSDYSKLTDNILICVKKTDKKQLKLTPLAASLFEIIGLDFNKICKEAKFTAERGQLIDLISPTNIKSKRIIIIGAGEIKKDNFQNQFEKIGGIIAKQLIALKQENISIILADETAEQVAQIAAGLRLYHYKFDKYKTKKSKNEESKSQEKLTITLHVNEKSASNKAIANSMAVVEGTLLARDMINEPPNILGPVEFAKKASELSSLGVEVEILSATDLKKLKMGALLAVAQGSIRPARLAIMRWNGAKKKDTPIAFVGKGVVFDTGGISIKPAGSMQEMKGDMGGAAAVIGLMKAVALRKAKANIIGVLGLVENMPDGNAYRPGDIITSMSGQTIEVINTDAEGRLVLADALYYTAERFKPKIMINLATLTGAVMVGLGQEYAGLFSNDDELATQLFDAGQKSDEKLWRLPLSKGYDKLIDSQFADMKNTGGRYGGAITAAQFLQRFVGETPWAHLDIAGTAFATKSNEINNGWASGFGVAVLDRFLRDNCEG